MSIKSRRRSAVAASVSQIRSILQNEVNVENLDRAKATLMQLCTQTNLFPRNDFPLPDSNSTERTFLIYQADDGSYALYVNSAVSGQRSRPHDHGGTWAIIAAIEGHERHRLYDNSSADSLRQVNEIEVRPGTSVSLMPDGIHAIEAIGDKPLLHLHLYGLGFELQSERIEYDLEHRSALRFKLSDLGFIEDAR